MKKQFVAPVLQPVATLARLTLVPSVSNNPEADNFIGVE